MSIFSFNKKAPTDVNWEEKYLKEKEKLTAVQSTALALVGSQDPDQIAATIADTARKLSGALLTAILILNKDKTVLHIKHISGAGIPIVQTGFKALGIDPFKLTFPVVDGSIIKQQMIKRQTIVTNSLFELLDKQLNKTVCDTAQSLVGIKTMVDYAIFTSENFLGMFACFFRGDVEIDFKLLETFSSQCAQALNAVDSIARMKEQVNETEKMNRFMIGRETEIINLKKRINSLLEDLGRPKEYSI